MQPINNNNSKKKRLLMIRSGKRSFYLENKKPIYVGLNEVESVFVFSSGRLLNPVMSPQMI